MVQKQEQQEQNIYSPYYYPNFSRYNYPSKIGGDEEQYTEQKFSFPRWDDEVQPYTPTTPILRRRASSPFSYSEDIDYFNNIPLSNNNDDTLLDPNDTLVPSDTSDSEDESEEVCDKIQSDIDLARKDQKSDYDQFRNAYATFHDDIRALQREIEAIESICMKNAWDLKRGGATVNDDGTEIYYEPKCTITTPSNNNINGGRLTSIPSATAAAAAARGLIGKKRSSPSILYRNRVDNQQQEQQQNTFNDNNNNNNSNNRRCLGIEDGWRQDRVHQNEGIRC